MLPCVRQEGRKTMNPRAATRLPGVLKTHWTNLHQRLEARAHASNRREIQSDIPFTRLVHF